MKKVVLISCVSKKLSWKAQAKDLYISPLFKFNLRYAQFLKPDHIFIISAKYGLVDLEETIEPYNQTLNKMRISEIKAWAQRVIKQLETKIDLKNDQVIFLAGEKYRKYLIPHISHYEVPLKGMGIGRQLQYLKQRLNNA